MTNLERLTMELSNRAYLTDEQYSVLLLENGLESGDRYMMLNRRALLSTVLDVLEILSNDIDLFRKTETEFLTAGAAYEALSDRLLKVKNKIAEIDSENGTKSESCFTVMYTGGL